MEKDEIEHRIKEVKAKIDDLGQRLHAANAKIPERLRTRPDQGTEDLQQLVASLQQELTGHREELRGLLERRSKMS